MLHREPANREYELRLFDRMIAGQTGERILLLEARGEMGKSTLLTAFERRCPADIPCVLIDLKGQANGLHEVFYRLCDALGWEQFPHFVQCVQGLAQITVCRNILVGGQIQVALQAPDEAGRQARRAELTQALFDDLHAWRGRLVLIFDTYEQADPEVQDWLAGPCLGRVRRMANLVVVIAGRRVPKESSEWAACCCHHRLGNIEDVEAWWTYVNRQGLPVRREWVEGYCVALQGHPGQMVKMLASAARWGGIR